MGDEAESVDTDDSIYYKSSEKMVLSMGLRKFLFCQVTRKKGLSLSERMDSTLPSSGNQIYILYVLDSSKDISFSALDYFYFSFTSDVSFFRACRTS